MLPNGNVLVFDNGLNRSNTFMTFSRVLEIDPSSNEVVWKYLDRSSAGSLYSPIVSSAQRLPNGNTLILEGLWGRMFQVTPEGEIVWEYINPRFTQWEESEDMYTNVIFRVRQYTKDELPYL